MSTLLSEEQKNFLNFSFGINLDEIGTENYSVYHQIGYQSGPLNLDINGAGQIFTTQTNGTLICLVLHNGNEVVKNEGCLLQDGFESQETI
jgi:hypothetical protein